MIYSAAAENFLRVKIMFGIVEDLHQERKSIEAQRDPDAKGNLLFLEMDTFDIRQSERAMVEAIIAFTVITLESLVNQALAEKITDVALACLAIEYPRKILEKTHNELKDVPGLYQKLAILVDLELVPENIAQSAKDLATARNQIVHDKPFYMETDHEGEVTYLPFKIRGKGEEKLSLEITTLPAVFSQADLVIEYINKVVQLDTDFRFCSLIQRLEDTE